MIATALSQDPSDLGTITGLQTARESARFTVASLARAAGVHEHVAMAAELGAKITRADAHRILAALRTRRWLSVTEREVL